MAACRACGQDNPEIARFCLACGARLDAAEALREERKVVTVLFADLVGFTSRAEQLDPEDVRAVLRPYWERLRAELERYGGTVEKFIGDAVMALFGAPVAHEDDPERAVRAALAIRDWLREEETDLQVRIAVATGEALVLLGAQPAEGEGMAAGDVVNTAARLQAAAPVNGVLVGESTYRATRQTIEYREHEPVVAKGKAEPVPVWEALQARSRPGMDLEQRALVPLVGRARELDTLVGALERVRRDREPQLVTLVGVPGIGKSRLVSELFAHVDGLPEIVRWRQGRALPYGQGVSFWGLAEMVKAEAGIHENDPPAEAQAKLAASIEAAVAAEDRPWIASRLRALVGLEAPDESTDHRDESFAAWRRYLEGLAEERPLVLVFEDLHWADDGLLDFVDHLADWASGVPLLVIGTARPELLDRRPDWGGGKLNAATVALAPLADEDAARIIASVLERALLSAGTQQALLERAGGNPLYAEQFARLYLERGSTDDLPLPENVQGLIAARLDGLGADEKRLLQDAAVVGKVFWLGAAVALTGLEREGAQRTLHVLERKGLVRRERRSAVGGEEEYAFRHALVRDVAYGQIPRGARGGKHARAASWIESLGRPDDHAELVAHHLSAAVELDRAAGGADEALVARARQALRRAGERALRLGAFEAAKRFFAGALELWPDDRERPYVLLGHATARYHGDGDRAALAEALEALRPLGDVEAWGNAAALAAQAAWGAGARAEAEELIGAARVLLAGRPPSPAQVAVTAEAARLDLFAGRRDEAVADCRSALRMCEELGLDEPRVSILTTLGVSALLGGDLDEAGALFEQAVQAGVTGTAAAEVARALANRSLLAWACGSYEDWLIAHRRAVEHATRIGHRQQLLWLEVHTVADLHAQGAWDEALGRIDDLLAAVEEIGGLYTERMPRSVRAAIRAFRGELEGAARDLEWLLARLDPSEDEQAMIPTHLAAASLSLVLGEEAKARELVGAALTRWRAEPLWMPFLPAGHAITIAQVGCGDELGELLARARPFPRVEATRLLLAGRWDDAAVLYGRMSGPLEEATVRLYAAERLAEAGRQAEADVQLRSALAFFRSVGAVRTVARAETLLSAG